MVLLIPSLHLFHHDIDCDQLAKHSLYLYEFSSELWFCNLKRETPNLKF